jgi:hypothetical protein
MKRCWLALSVVVVASLASSAAAAAEGMFMPIFDGKTLKGWDGNPKFWSVEEGTITGRTTADNPTSGNTFLIWKDGEVADFELKLKFRIVGGNSGIQYRSKDKGNWVVGGYQADFDAPGGYSGILYEEQGRGILAMRGNKVVIDESGEKKNAGTTTPEKEILESIKKEDWNEYEVVAQGNHLIHKINGKVTVDVTDNQTDKQAAKGILALQLHAGPPMLVQFKDIQLKVLK